MPKKIGGGQVHPKKHCFWEKLIISPGWTFRKQESSRGGNNETNDSRPLGFIHNTGFLDRWKLGQSSGGNRNDWQWRNKVGKDVSVEKGAILFVEPGVTVKYNPGTSIIVKDGGIDARRNLLEVLKGVRVDATTYVENHIAKSDEIRLQAEGLIQGSTEIKKMRRYLSDGAIEMTVAMNLSGDFLALMFSLPEALPTAKPPSSPLPLAPQKPGVPTLTSPQEKKMEVPPAEKPEVRAEEKPAIKPESPKPESKPLLAELPPYTGLVVDTRGLNMRAALIPKVLDEKGLELYQGMYVPPGKPAQSGLALYSKDLTAAQTNPRVGKNPLTVKGFKVNPGNPSDIILSSEEAKRVSPFTQKGTFLEECKVMIVID